MTPQQKQSKAIYERVKQLMDEGKTTPEITKVMRKEKFSWNGKLVDNALVSKRCYALHNHGIPKFKGRGKVKKKKLSSIKTSFAAPETGKLEAIRTIVNLPNVVSDQDKLCLINNLVN